MNEVTSKIAVFLLIASFQGIVLCRSLEARGDCVELTVAGDGAVVVRFALPEKLATPPWDPDTLAEHGFSLEKHGSLPYFPVRPVALEIGSNAVSMELLKSKVVEVPDVIREASETPQPVIESDILLGPRSQRPIPITAFPESSFPTQHVVADKPVTFGKKTIVRVKIHPFARENERSPPTRADLLVFRVSPSRLGLIKESVAKPAKSSPAGKTGASRPLIISTASDGIYAIRADDMFSFWGADPLSLSSLSLTCGGQDVAYYASGDGDELLEAGESILFYGLGGDNIFTRENAYWLTPGEQAVTVQSLSQPPPAEGSVTRLPRKARFYHSYCMYDAQPPGTGDDRWFMVKITSPEEWNIHIQIHSVADSPDFEAELRVGLQGASSSHATRISINGNLLVEEEWQGLVPKVVQTEFSQELLQEGENIVSVQQFREGQEPDIAYLDWIEVRYDSELAISEDQLTVTVPANTPGIIVSGLLDENALIFDVTSERTPYLIEDFSATPANGSFRVEFGTMADSEKRYIVLSSGSAKLPSSIRQRSESAWSNEENSADYIVIAHSDFLDAARRLTSHRESQGLRTAVVDVQDVYDEFNHGVLSPEAVRDFVKFAYRNWQPPAPRYLVLFGDGHADYMDWFETHEPNFILPHYSWIPPLGWAPDDGWFGCVEGDDPLPEVFVGRFPVRSAAEAETVVDKMIGYDSVAVPQEWQKRVTFCASAGNFFQSICRSIAKGVPPNFERHYLFRDDFPDVASLKEAILNSLNAGTFFFFYAGHGTVERWSEYILHVSDTPSMTNAEKLPIMCILTCLSGYFAVPLR
ncbi:hypothetical protein HQ563_05900, partial [bacterium]|nr:hypothetical protein [bacterium]